MFFNIPYLIRYTYILLIMKKLFNYLRRKVYWRYRNYRFLKRVLKEDLSVNNFWFVKNTFLFYCNYKKNGCERNLAAEALKKVRQKYPYHIKGWTENQKIYEEYFTLPGAIQSLEDVKELLEKGDVYVTIFRGESVYKGEKEFQYSSVATILKEPIVYKIYDFKNGYAWLGKNSFMNLTEEWMTAFRYSTPEEIENHRTKGRKRKELQKKIDRKQKEILELYKLL